MIDYFSSLDIFGWLEIVAMVVGFLYVLFQIKKTRKMWYFCILSAIVNIFVFGHNNYISMMAIQFYYIVTAIYGLVQWTKVKSDAIGIYGEDAQIEGSHPIPIKKFNWKIGVAAIALTVMLFFVLSPIIRNYAVSAGTIEFPAQPYLDTFIAVCSMLGAFFLSKSYFCQWFVWLIVNAFSVYVFIRSGMYYMAAMYASYLVMSVIGIMNWKKRGVYLD